MPINKREKIGLIFVFILFALIGIATFVDKTNTDNILELLHNGKNIHFIDISVSSGRSEADTAYIIVKDTGVLASFNQALMKEVWELHDAGIPSIKRMDGGAKGAATRGAGCSD